MGSDAAVVVGSPAEAVEAMLAGVRLSPREAQTVTLDRAGGLFLAEAVRADRDSPAFDCSSMDGYAVRLRDLAESPVLEVAGECRIGSPPIAMPDSPGAVRIATGAPLPVGLRPQEAILRREDVREISGAEATDVGRVSVVASLGEPGRARASAVVRIEVPRSTCEACRPGQFIRRKGENGLRGQVVAESGTEISAAVAGVLASVGCLAPVVCRPVRVVVVTTGDEVVGEGDPGQFQIRNANAATLGAALRAHRWIGSVDAVHTPDNEAAVLAALRRGLENADAIILSGGVSMGHRDPVRAAVEQAGAEVVFHGVPQRPGKPMLGAVARRGARAIPIFGLPGNPVSTLVTCTRIVVPVLAALAGARAGTQPPAAVTIERAGPQRIDLWWHRPVRLTGPGVAEIVESRGSGDLFATSSTHGFVELPPRWPDGREAGPVAFYPWPG